MRNTVLRLTMLISMLSIGLGLALSLVGRGATGIEDTPDSVPMREQVLNWLKLNNAWGPEAGIVQNTGTWVDKRIAADEDFSILYGAGTLKSQKVTLTEVHYGQLYVFEYNDQQAKLADIKPTQQRMLCCRTAGIRSNPLEATVFKVTLDGQSPYDVTKRLTGEITYDIPNALPVTGAAYILHLQYTPKGPAAGGSTPNTFDYFDPVNMHAAPLPGKAKHKFSFDINASYPVQYQCTGPLVLYFDIARLGHNNYEFRQTVSPISNTIALLVDIKAPPPTAAQLAAFEAAKPQNLDLDNKPRLASGNRKFKNSIGMQFVEIKPGSFIMGTPKEEPGRTRFEVQHVVTLSKGFMMGANLVTVGQFKVFVAATGYKTEAETDGGTFYVKDPMTDGRTFKNPEINWRTPGFEQTDDHPVVCISWNDAQAFAHWLSKKEGKSYRLPTEAQWEGACRAGTSTAFYWGNNPNDGKGFCNVGDESLEQKFPNDITFNTFNWNDGYVFTSPVGKFRPNAWGLYDMCGNAHEWCNDWFGDYPRGPVTDPFNEKWRNGLPARVLRGGSWGSGPKNCRSGANIKNGPEYRYADYGFRLALDLVVPKIDPIADATHLIEMYPDSAQAYADRGYIKVQMGNVDGALADYNQSLKIGPGCSDSLRNCGLILQARGDLQGALADLKAYSHTKTSLDPVECYGYLWVWMVQAQLGQKAQADQDLAAYLKIPRAPRIGVWPSTIAAFFLDQINEHDFLTAAHASEPSQRNGNLCEAWYYAGIKRLIAGDKTTAADYFAKCLSTNEIDFTEYQSAQLELKSLSK